MDKIITILSVLFLFLSCEKETYSSQKCDELSQLSFKGMPKAAKDFKDHCQGVEIKFSKEICQRALNDLILSGDLPGVKQKYGQKIDRCFSERDLKTFKK